MLKDIIKGGTLILISVILSKILSLLYIPVLARVLGPANLGLYNLALVVLPWFVTLISFSFATIIAQSVAEHRKNKKQLPTLITTYIVFTLLLSAIGAFFHLFLAKFIAVYFFHSPPLIDYLRLASAAIATAILYNLTLGIARGMKDFRLYFQMEVSKSFVFVLLGLLFLLFFRYQIKGALFAVIFSPLIPVAHLLFNYRGYLTRNIRLHLVLKNFKLGFWVTLLSLFLTVLLTADKFLLGVYTDPATVGLYAAVATLITALSLISSSFKGSILPFISESFTDTKKIRSMIQKMLSYTLILLSMALLTLVAFREEIIFLLFGKEFLPAAFILPVLAFALIPFTVYTLVHSVILDRRLVAWSTRRIFFITLFALGIDIYLVKHFSAFGAGFGLLTSHSLIALMYLYILRKEFAFPILSLLPLLSIIVLALSAALFLPAALSYRIPLFLLLGVSYISLLFLFRLITSVEVGFFFAKLKNIFTRFRF